MSDQLKNFLHGVGSVMDIFPDTSKQIHARRKDQEELMKQAWNATGIQFKQAITQISNEQEQKKRSAKSR